MQHTKSVRGTKREAEAALAQLVLDVSQDRVVDSRANLGELLEAWFERAKGDLSPSTQRTTIEFVKRYIMVRSPPISRRCTRRRCPRRRSAGSRTQ